MSKPISWLLWCAALMPAVAGAAQSYDNCTGFVDTVPATLTTPGTWCLRQNLSTPMSSGTAIVLASDDITLDCNGFRLSGLAAGFKSDATGIGLGSASPLGRRNAVIRHCRVQGFQVGIHLWGSGHVIERNTVNDSLGVGIAVRSEDAINIVRDNHVIDSGARPRCCPYEGGGISSSGGGLIENNTVSGVASPGNPEFQAFGIRIAWGGGLARNNAITGLVPGAAAWASGFRPSGAVLRDNQILQVTATHGYGVEGDYVMPNVCRDNDLQRYSTSFGTCHPRLGNTVMP